MSDPRRAPSRWPMVLPVLLAAAAFLPFLRNGFINDDYTWLDRTIDTLDHPSMLLTFPGKDFRPLASLAFLVNFRFSRLDPFGYDLFNLLIHLVNVALVMRLVLRVTAGRRDLAFVAGALWGIGFGNWGGAVAWIANRTGLLADLFMLASLLSHARWLEKGRARDLAATLGCFALALLSKESAAMLIPLLLLLEWTLGAPVRELARPRRLLRYLPHALLPAAFVAYELLVFRRGSTVIGHEYAIGPHAIRNFAEYLSRMWMPLNPTSSLVNVPWSVRRVVQMVQPALMVGLPVAGVWLFVRRPERWVRFALLWVAINLVPFVFFTFRTDTRYLYNPSIGTCLLVAGIMSAWRRRAALGPAAWGWLPPAALAALLLTQVLVLESVLRAQDHKSRTGDPQRYQDLVDKLAAHDRRVR